MNTKKILGWYDDGSKTYGAVFNTNDINDTYALEINQINQKTNNNIMTLTLTMSIHP